MVINPGWCGWRGGRCIETADIPDLQCRFIGGDAGDSGVPTDGARDAVVPWCAVAELDGPAGSVEEDRRSSLYTFGAAFALLSFKYSIHHHRSRIRLCVLFAG